MKVLMLNGSAKPLGNTYLSLLEVGKELEKLGIEYEIFQLGGGPIRDCIGCGQCEGMCPQHLPIIQHLKAVSEYYDK